MRRTIPILFLVLLVSGAAAIGFSLAWLMKKELHDENIRLKERVSNFKIENDELLLQNRKQLDNLNSLQQSHTHKLQLSEELNKTLETQIEDLGRLNVKETENRKKFESRARELDEQQAGFIRQLETRQIELEKSKKELETARGELEASKLQDAGREEQNKREKELEEVQKGLQQKLEQVEAEYGKLSTTLTDTEAKLDLANEENKYLYQEVERLSRQSKAIISRLGTDLGGLDFLLTPELKADFSVFLREIGLDIPEIPD